MFTSILQEKVQLLVMHITGNLLHIRIATSVQCLIAKLHFVVVEKYLSVEKTRLQNELFLPTTVNNYPDLYNPALKTIAGTLFG